MGTLISVQYCATGEPWFAIKVLSKSDPEKIYEVKSPYPDDLPEELICECDGFLYRGKCSHQQIAFDKLCRWTEVDGPEQQTMSQKDLQICPRCQGNTIKKTAWI